MRVISGLVCVGIILLLAGCSTNSPAVDSRIPISCDLFLNPQSALAAEIAAFDKKPKCEKVFGPEGGYVEAFGAAGTADKTQKAAPGTMIIVYRYYNWNEKLEPLGASDLPDSTDFKVLPDRIPVPLDGAEDGGRVASALLKTAQVTYVCLSSNTINKNGSRSLVEFCRPAATRLDDAGTLNLAQKIAASDLIALIP